MGNIYAPFSYDHNFCLKPPMDVFFFLCVMVSRRIRDTFAEFPQPADANG